MTSYLLQCTCFRFFSSLKRDHGVMEISCKFLMIPSVHPLVGWSVDWSVGLPLFPKGGGKLHFHVPITALVFSSYTAVLTSSSVNRHYETLVIEFKDVLEKKVKVRQKKHDLPFNHTVQFAIFMLMHSLLYNLLSTF